MRFQPSLQIKRQILRTILEGQYQPGSVLPTIQAMSETFKVSTKTVQKAVHALSEDGVIEAKRGVGLFVRPFDPQAGRGKRVGLVLASDEAYLAGSPYPARMLDCLKEGLAQGGYSLVPCPLVQFDRLALVESLAKLKLSGFVLFEIDNDHLISEIRELRLPLISLDYDAYRYGISSVSFDNLFGTFQATRHLQSLGHRRIVFMRPLVRNAFHSNMALDAVEEERLKGYRLAMQQAALAPQVQEYPNALPSLKEALLGLFGRRPAPTAFVCVADWSATMVAKESLRLGFRIPEDVSVIGFGDHQAEYAPGLKLSSVTIDPAGMGEAGARLMLEALKGGARPQRRILACEVVPRESVAPLEKAESAVPALGAQYAGGQWNA